MKVLVIEIGSEKFVQVKIVVERAVAAGERPCCWVEAMKVGGGMFLPCHCIVLS